MNIILDLLKVIIQSIAEVLERCIILFKKDHRLKAHYGNKRLLSRRNTGYAIGEKQLPASESDKSKIIIGPSGTGKSTLFYMNSLFVTEGNFVVLDVSGQLLETCGQGLRERGYSISVINPNMAKDSTHGWNPLQALKNSTESTKSFATLVINNAMNKTSDVFWNLSSINLLALFIDFMFESLPEKEHTMYHLKRLLQQFAGDPDSFDAKFADANLVSDTTYESYRAFVASDQKIITGVLANCQAALGVYDNEDVARVTSTHNFSMEEFITQEKQAVFIQNSVLSQEFLRPINSVFFFFFFETLMRQLRPEQPMIYFMIDEASSIKLGSMLPLCLVNLRKYRSSICLGVQSFQQLETIYSREDAINILQNSYIKVFLRNLDIGFSKTISEMLGAYTYQDAKSETDRNRMLLTPDMIRSMRAEECLLFVGAERGIYLKKVKPFYKIRKHLVLSKLPKLELPSSDLPMPVVQQMERNADVTSDEC